MNSAPHSAPTWVHDAITEIDGELRTIEAKVGLLTETRDRLRQLYGLAALTPTAESVARAPKSPKVKRLKTPRRTPATPSAVELDGLGESITHVVQTSLRPLKKREVFDSLPDPRPRLDQLQYQLKKLVRDGVLLVEGATSGARYSAAGAPAKEVLRRATH